MVRVPCNGGERGTGIYRGRKGEYAGYVKGDGGLGMC